MALNGKNAIVTGADSGIGAAIARGFAAAGAVVGVNHVGPEHAAQEIVAEIRGRGGQAVALKADVASESDVRAMFEAFIGDYGRIDIVVANAGVQQDAAITQMTLEQWRKVLDVNLTGAFLCAREAIRHFIEQGIAPASRATGNSIFMSSVHQRIPWSGHVNYAASKGGMAMLMESLAQEVAQRKIRINSIAPGAIKTHINQAVWSDPEKAREMLKLIPYGRIGEPEDVAKAALWLASDESDYVTGTTLFVDGGMTLYPAFRANG